MAPVFELSQNSDLLVPSATFSRPALILPNHIVEAASLKEASALLKSPEINAALVEGSVYKSSLIAEELREFWRTAKIDFSTRSFESLPIEKFREVARSALHDAGLPIKASTRERTDALHQSTEMWLDEMESAARWCTEFCERDAVTMRFTNRYATPGSHIDRGIAFVGIAYDGFGPRFATHEDMLNYGVSEFDYNFLVRLKEDAREWDTPPGVMLLSRDLETHHAPPTSRGGLIHWSPIPQGKAPYPNRFLFLVGASMPN